MAPRETENNAYAKFWGDKQRTLWYVMVFLEWSIGFTTTLPMMRFGPFRKSLCWSGKGKSTFEFCNISLMQRLLNPIFNVVNCRLWVILKNDLAFCSGFGTYHNQSSFFPLNALQLVWFGCGSPPLHVSITGLFWGLFALFLPCQELNWRADALINTFYSWWDQRSSLNVVLFTRRP